MRTGPTPFTTPIIPIDKDLIAQIIREKVKAEGPFHVWYPNGHGAPYCVVDPNGIDEAADTINSLIAKGREGYVLE